MPGTRPLRAAVAAKIQALHGRQYDADTEITITAGATQAIITAILACVHPGDEGIVLDPCYDSYVPNIVLATRPRRPRAPDARQFPPGLRQNRRRHHGAHARAHHQQPAQPQRHHLERCRNAPTATALAPHPHPPPPPPPPPRGPPPKAPQRKAVWAPTDILLISDEVYEHMVFDGAEHQSAARFAGLAARAFIVSSFGKTFHVTGWKVGTMAAPAALTAEFRKVHQFNVFTVNTPMQHGLASYLKDPAPYLRLPAFYQAKRDLFRQGLADTRLKLLPSAGSYFQCVDISSVSTLNESDFCQWLTREVGVAAIPLSAFYGDGFDQRVVRLCFAKKDETLRAALERLRKL